MSVQPAADSRRQRVRPVLAAVTLLLGYAFAGVALAGEADTRGEPHVTVREEGGVYTVAARFRVPQQPRIVLEVLTDYEDIPRFMPDIKRSVVLDRSAGRVMVEQEAVSGMIMFSRRIHLLLEVQEAADRIQFRDASGRSFTRYEGTWHFVRHDGQTFVTYELSAQPTFSVPEFLLKRVLRRDAQTMIEQLRAEMAARSPSAAHLQTRGPDTTP